MSVAAIGACAFAEVAASSTKIPTIILRMRWFLPLEEIVSERCSCRGRISHYGAIQGARRRRRFDSVRAHLGCIRVRFGCRRTKFRSARPSFESQKARRHMARKLCVLIGLLTLFAGTAPAQSVDARKALEASSKAMGADNLKSIQYSGNGWFSNIGQTYGLAEDWPHYEVADYTRVVDYGAQWSREDYTRRQGKYPTLGRAPIPEQHITTILSGNYAWDMHG